MIYGKIINRKRSFKIIQRGYEGKITGDSDVRSFCMQKGFF